MGWFRDGEAFILPGATIGFMRGKEICEGTCTVERVDVKTKTVYLSPIPNGIRPGDQMIEVDK